MRFLNQNVLFLCAEHRNMRIYSASAQFITLIGLQLEEYHHGHRMQCFFGNNMRNMRYQVGLIRLEFK